ncbi:MAG: flippase [bacterium]|nr:flippase [bacterium]
MEKEYRIFKNSTLMMISQFLSHGLLLVMIILIARHLGSADFGKYSMAFAFVGIFLILADMGLSTIGLRGISRDKMKGPRYLVNLLFMKGILSLLMIIIIVLVSYLLGFSREVRNLIFLFGLAQIINSLARAIQIIFNASEKMEYTAIISFIFNLSLFGLVGITIAFSGDTVHIVLAYLGASIVQFALTLIILLRRFIRRRELAVSEIDLSFCRLLLKEALPIALFGIFVGLYFRIDTVMLSFFKGDEAAGLYSGAYKFLEGVAFIGTCYRLAIFPVLSRSFELDPSSLRSIYERSIKHLLIIALPLSVIIFLLADKLIFLLLSEEYARAVPVLRIIIWAISFTYLNDTLLHILISINRQGFTTITVAIGAIFNILTNLIFIPKWGYIGAGITTLLSEALVTVIGFAFLAKFLVRPNIFSLISGVVAANITFGVLIYSVLKVTGSLLAVLLLSITYLPLLFIFRVIRPGDISFFLSRIKGMRLVSEERAAGYSS